MDRDQAETTRKLAWWRVTLLKLEFDIKRHAKIKHYIDDGLHRVQITIVNKILSENKDFVLIIP